MSSARAGSPTASITARLEQRILLKSLTGLFDLGPVEAPNDLTGETQLVEDLFDLRDLVGVLRSHDQTRYHSVATARRCRS